MLPLEIYLLTFNCGREFVDPRTLGAHFFQAWPKGKRLPDIISIALQEIAPIPEAFRGPDYIAPYIRRIAKTVDVATLGYTSSETTQDDSSKYTLLKWRSAGMTAQAIFVNDDIADQIEHILVADVGVGVSSMGNKGAAGVRLVFSPQSTSATDPVVLTFVSAHLYPHEGGCEKRNADWKAIVQNLVFESDAHESHHLTFTEDRNESSSDTTPLLSKSPNGDSNSSSSSEYATPMFTPNSYLFFAGDLNYRTADKGPSPEDYLNYPQPNAAPNDPHHYTHLLESDQLSREKAAGRTLHHLMEGPIHFPPTYKYVSPKAQIDLDPEHEIWAFSKNRMPSWCDRILFTRKNDLKVHKYDCLPVQGTSDHRPVALSVSLSPSGSNDPWPESPFAINPDHRADRNLAVMKEVIVGNAAFLGLTTKGRALVGIAVVGLITLVLVIKVLA